MMGRRSVVENIRLSTPPRMLPPDVTLSKYRVAALIGASLPNAPHVVLEPRSNPKGRMSVLKKIWISALRQDFVLMTANVAVKLI